MEKKEGCAFVYNTHQRVACDLWQYVHIACLRRIRSSYRLMTQHSCAVGTQHRRTFEAPLLSRSPRAQRHYTVPTCSVPLPSSCQPRTITQLPSGCPYYAPAPSSLEPTVPCSSPLPCCSPAAPGRSPIHQHVEQQKDELSGGSGGRAPIKPHTSPAPACPSSI